MSVQALPRSKDQTKDKHYAKAAGVYRSIVLRKAGWLALGALLLVLLFLLNIAIGPASLSLHTVIDALFYPHKCDSQSVLIVHQMRLPIAVMAVVVGGSLAVAGLEMQTLLDNPLASPFTLGISSAASFGASLAIVVGISLLPHVSPPLVVSGSAFVFAVGCCLVIAIISSVKRGSAHSIILAGIAMVFLFDAAAAMLKYVAKDDQLAAITSWAFGTLENAEFSQVEVIAAILAFSLFFLIANSWKLTGVSLGDDKARSLGINVQKLKFETLIVVSLLTAISVSFVGIIGFVGLVAPHVARKLVGDDQRYLIPATCLWGAVLLSAASILSKIVITGVVIPIGIMTSLIGVPFLFALIVKKN